MDIETAKTIIPKLESLRTFINNVAIAGQYLPDNQTRANYRAIYADIKATLNDPKLEIYAPPLPHLGTTSDNSTLWEEHQIRILDSGYRLIKYIDSQLIPFSPRNHQDFSTTTPKSPLDIQPNINIEHFQGILGNVENSKVAQNLESVVVKGDFESLRRKLYELKVDQKDIDELRKAIEIEPAIKDQTVFGKNVGAWIGKMVKNAATGAWDIGVNTAGNVLALLIARYYGF